MSSSLAGGREVELVESIIIDRQIELKIVGVDHLETSPAFGDAIDAAWETSGSQQQFIEKLKARDEAAFEELVNENTPAIYSMLVRLIKSTEEAQDLT
ncbi:MAG: RNA polymerase sigma factor, partial [Pyrinomonadaceae bacterium]